MTQIISRDGIVICVTTVPYPAWIIKDMKQAGYKIKNVEDWEYLKGKESNES